MQNFENFEDYFPQEEKVNYRKVLIIILRKWHWFLLFGVLGISFGYLYSRYSQPGYQTKAFIYVPPKSSGLGTGLENLFQSTFMGDRATEVYNQIEIIKSFNINYQVAQHLNWKTSWYKMDLLSLENLKEKSLFNWAAYYKNEPFNVEIKEGAYNCPGIELHVKPLSSRQYEISVNGDLVKEGVKKRIEFTAIGTYGEPFANYYFHFTLTPKDKSGENMDCLYYFVFNEPAQIASAYLDNLVVKLNDKKSEIICLQLQGKEPKRDIDYLNELIQVYMQDKMDFQTETQKRSLSFLDSKLLNVSDSLNSAGTNFTQFKSQNQIINIGAQGTQVMTTLKDIETDRNKNQLQLDYFRNTFDYLENSNDVKQLISPSVVGIQDISLNTMVVKLSELYSRRQVLSFSAKENNPTLVMTDKEIAQTKVRLKENLRNLISDAEVMKKSLDSQKNKISTQLDRLPKKEQDMINFQRRFDLTNGIYTFLLQKRAEIDISLAGATPEVQVIDAARIETSDPVGLSPLYKIIIGLMLGLAVPGFFLLIFHFFSNTIESQEDVEKNTQLAVLGSVIHNPTKSDTAVNDNPQSGIAESYRSIRTNLQFMLTSGSHKIVAIHSTNTGEGKSFTSVNLATILAMNDKKVLLVGADMRKPRMHKIFKLSNQHGLSTYLSGYDQLDEVIFETFVENLSLLPAGPIPPNPSELLDKPQMGTLMGKLREKYDYVILDNAPVSLVTDSLLAGRHADLNIFILRYAISRIDQFKYINQIAEKKVLDNIALIINDIKGSGFGYGRNYYYNYTYANNSGYYEENEKPSGLKRIFGKKINHEKIERLTNHHPQVHQKFVHEKNGKI
jgi:tyrosine-protein kinase Etk/Wzc